MNKEKQRSVLKKIKKRISNCCFNFNDISKSNKENEETIKNIIYHYVGEENIINLDIHTNKKNTVVINMKLVENEHTKYWIDFFEKNNIGDNANE